MSSQILRENQRLNADMPKCPECEFDYVAGIPSNTRAHRKYHDEMVNGIPAKPLANDRIIWEEVPYRITVVNAESPTAQKKCAERSGIVARRDTPFDFKPYSAVEVLDERNVHLFLLHHQERIVGLLVVEKRSHIWKCTWEERERHVFNDLSDRPPIWSVGLVWVNRQHRRKGFGCRLAAEAARFWGIQIRQLGWQTPLTESGAVMIRKLCPDEFYIAK
jgi:hypothetical protein